MMDILLLLYLPMMSLVGQTADAMRMNLQRHNVIIKYFTYEAIDSLFAIPFASIIIWDGFPQ